MNNNFFLISIILFSFSFLTANSYAATLTVTLLGEQNPADFSAVVTGTAIDGNRQEKDFNTGDSVTFDVHPGNYIIRLLSDANILFGVDIQNSDECDNTIGSDNDNEICEVRLGNSIDGSGLGNPLGDGAFGADFSSIPNMLELPPAKFNVKTQISDECLASPTCKYIKERDIQEEVYRFSSTTNEYELVSNFDGSNLSRHLVFDDDIDFRYGKIQLETYAHSIIHPRDYNDEGGIRVNIEYHSCSVYLAPGEEANCIVVVKPYNPEVLLNKIQ